MRKFIISALLVCVLAMSAMAATIDFTIEDTDVIKDLYLSEYDGIYAIKATVNSEGGTFTGCEVVVEYDPAVFQAVQYPLVAYDKMVDVDILTSADKACYGPILAVELGGRFGPTFTYASPVQVKAEQVGDRIRVTAAYQDTVTYAAATDLTLFKLFFRYADGKSAADIAYDYFRVEYLQYDDYALHTSFATDGRYGLPDTEIVTANVDFLPEGGEEEPEGPAVDETLTTTEKEFIDVCPVYKTNFATPADEYGFIGALATTEDGAFQYGADGVISAKVEATEAGEYTVIVKGVPSGESVKVRPYYIVEGSYFYGAVVTYTAA